MSFTRRAVAMRLIVHLNLHPLPHYTFLIAELVTYVVAGFCMRHAYRQHRSLLYLLLNAMLAGYCIEAALVVFAEGYDYGRFLVMLPGPVPLSIAMGWGVIIYAAMQISDLMAVPFLARPVCDALLALSIDFSLDPMAETLGYWHWVKGGQYFGVPYQNFLGWFMIVSGFTVGTRLAYRWLKVSERGWANNLLACALALGITGGGMLLAQLARTYIFGPFGEIVPFMLVYVFAIGVVIIDLDKLRHDRVLDPVLLLVPSGLHGYLVLNFALTGSYNKLTEFVVLMPLLVVVSLVAFAFPYFDQLLRLRRGSEPLALDLAMETDHDSLCPRYDPPTFCQA